MENCIKEKRSEIGMSQGKLANLVGIARSTISRYENEIIEKIPYQHSIALASVLGCSVEELFKGESPDEKHNAEEELLRRFAMLTDEGKHAVLTIVREMT